jgi:predicted DNA-binding transcriptional regulator AlpA
MKESDSTLESKIWNGHNNHKRLYSVREAAIYLGISPRTIYNSMGKNSKQEFPVPHKRYGRKILFEGKDLDLFADSL